MNNKKLVAELEVKIESLSKKLSDFAVKFQERPMDALEWADASFESAAKVYVYKIFLHMLKRETPASIEELRAYATQRAVDGARYPSRSTSVCSNLMNQCETAAWADSLDPLCGILFDF